MHTHLELHVALQITVNLANVQKLLTVPALNGDIFHNKARILINYFTLGTSLQMYTVHILFFHNPLSTFGKK